MEFNLKIIIFSIVAILTLVTINKYQATSLPVKSLEQRQIYTQQAIHRRLIRRNAPANNTAEQITHTVPFLILLSGDEVSIAQLPLIDDGHMSVVYSIADSSYVISDELKRQRANSNEETPDANEVGSSVRQETKNRDREYVSSVSSVERFNGESSSDSKQQQQSNGTDAREYEQQMPASSGSSLGKSETWSQSVARNRDKEVVRSLADAGRAKGEPEAEKEEEGLSRSTNVGISAGNEMGLRPRRSSGNNSVTAATDDGNNEHYGNSKASSDQDLGLRSSSREKEEDAASVLESGNANVTSAQFVSAAAASSDTVGHGRGSESASASTSALSAADNGGRKETSGEEAGPSDEAAAKKGGSAAATSSRVSSSPAEVSQSAAAAAASTKSAIASNRRQENTAAQAAKSMAQFCDIDVHMALGYAFVADSAGRVHRIRLMPPIKPQHPLETGPDANSIDAASENEAELSSRAPLLIRANITRQSSSAESDQAAAVDDDDDEANLLAAEQNNATSVQSTGGKQHQSGGQHPAASGGATQRHLLSSMKPEWLSSSSPAAATTSTSGDSSNQEKHGFDYAYWQKASLVSASSSKPRIIWPRNKRGFIQRSDSSVAMQQQQVEVGALPAQTQRSVESVPQMQLVAAQPTQRQMADGTQAPGGSSGASSASNGEADEPATGDSPATSESGEQAINNDEPNGLRHMRTEIAVDWLSDLLFVLDKYRLIVMDLEGNNELVLIDDFTPSNRPIELRLDPSNDFLYWLQVGNFHNTIYKLDLRVLSLPTARERLYDNYINLGASRSSRNLVFGSSGEQANENSELVALVSHHYAHPIITNLPKNTKLFIINHKHSRIYVPLTADPSAASSSMQSHSHPTDAMGSEEVQTNKTMDETEVFGSRDDSTNLITHLNSTGANSPNELVYGSEKDDCNANGTDLYASPLSTRLLQTQLVAFNLDGTDVGPVRGAGERAHLYNLDDMQDITMDADKGLLYWLTNDGKELFEEFRTERDATLYSAQHNLDGKRFQKVAYFENKGFNQPTNKRSRFSVRHLMQKVSSQTIITSTGSTTDRHTRSDSYGPEPRFDGTSATNTTRLARNAPYIILGLTCVAVLVIYLVYALVFQQLRSNRLMDPAANNASFSDVGRHFRRRRGSSSPEVTDGSSSLGEESHSDPGVNTFAGLPCSSTVRRWIARPTRHNADTTASTFNRRDETSADVTCGGVNNNTMQDSELSGCYRGVGNAVDEHYRDSDVINAADLFDIVDSTRLANLSKWPTNMHDLSNKLYVPVEVARDEALAQIRRVSVDELEIEKECPPLGEGHFGTVLQGMIKCTIQERNILLGSSVNQPSSSDSYTVYQQTQPADSRMITFGQRRPAQSTASSSGHGSSSTSSEFVTARTRNGQGSSRDATTQDYLTPKSNCASTMSDYTVENGADSCISYQSVLMKEPSSKYEHEANNEITKLRVAIKKLRENASAEEKRDFLQEAKLLASFDHPNIVHLIGISLDRGATLIVMELMLGGDLIRYMQNNKPCSRSEPDSDLTNDDLMKICLDIVNGCCYLEELNYIHRDLAARNCLVSSKKCEERVVKLADFGLARDIYKDSYYKKLNDSAMPLKWMAPESLSEQKFTTMSDVWSFGVVMWEVMSYCQEKPYSNVEPFFMKNHLQSGARLRKPDYCSDDMYRLMNQCWQLEPKDRPTFQECRATLIEIRNSSAKR